MPGLFTQAGRVYADTRRKTQELQQADADRKYQEEQRAIQRLAVMEGLRGQGLVPDQEAQQMQGAVQAAKATDFLTPGTDMSGVETPSVQQAGAGFSRVSTLTPEHRQRVAEAMKQRKAQEAEQSLKSMMQRALAGDEEAKALLLARSPSLANSVFKEKPRSDDEVVALEGRKAEARARAAAKYRPSRAAGSSVSKGATFEANWKGRRYQELVRGVVDRNSGVVMTPGLSPQAAQAKVQQEWEGLSKVIPPAYLKAAENDPEYAAYLRAHVGGGDPEEDQ